ncbi:HAMP domain-containing sensor histidine kinase [Siphonobacter sp. SORGH_AS_0500]|uniref:sensor histidine kinase n=1 Tax=Siphonobacter sp. SORGH_AS_0500 TaxID=1864824 RepID=UPI00285461C0|nr:HAMP domain-containing sensor histidine kinase [Siphonobacter sp. SORGH_AS_0500]MDR6197383.1 signal transduction histidine kinase [Siphonobacter sp. SORGH_AS_0500]
MTKRNSVYTNQIKQLTDYLFARQETILNLWRTRCSEDNNLLTGLSFSREEFNDELAVLLNVLSQRLQGKPEQANALEHSGTHGLHRWQRGYTLAELVNELNHLYDIIDEQFMSFLELYPQTQSQVMVHAYRQLLRLSKDINRGSVMYFDQLRQTAAIKQVQTLEEALDNLQSITHQRGEHLRQVSHDLQGSLGVLSGVANLLKLPSKKADREKFMELLTRNLQAVEIMLRQLMNYARLEAGQEVVENQPFDASELVQQLVRSVEGLAKAKQLVLQADGPEQLVVVGDAMKVRRIIQNLLLNALMYTESGWVNVSWALENKERWLISIQDTGPGLLNGPFAPLAHQLQPQVEPTSAHQPDGPLNHPTIVAPTSTEKGSSSKGGEGIGLFIVKRMCELLKASMDIETSEKGTLIRIRLPVE